MFISSIGNINNAAFATMQNNQARTNLATGAGDGSFKDMGSVHQADKKFQMDNLNNNLVYDATSLMEEAQRKQQKEDIKRSFSTFA